MTREFNKLIEIIEQKKQSLIEQITNEYNLLVGDSTNQTAQLQNEIEINRALEEIISFTFENGDDNALLEVSLFQHLCWSHFLTLLKGDSNTSVFL